MLQTGLGQLHNSGDLVRLITVAGNVILASLGKVQNVVVVELDYIPAGRGCVPESTPF